MKAKSMIKIESTTINNELLNQITQLQEHFKENKARLTELENLNKTVNDKIVNEVKTQIVFF
jgi:hypothetical protein